MNADEARKRAESYDAGVAASRLNSQTLAEIFAYIEVAVENGLFAVQVPVPNDQKILEFVTPILQEHKYIVSEKNGILTVGW